MARSPKLARVAFNGRTDFYGGAGGSFAVNGYVSKTGASLARDLVQGISTLTYGGTLTVTNIGPDSPAEGDVCRLFSATAYTGSFMNYSLPSLPTGFMWDKARLSTGMLAVVPAPTVATNATNITFELVNGGAELKLSWPASHTGWRLEAQTNALNIGISNNWVPVPGSVTTNVVYQPVVQGNPTVFYRLIYQLN